MGDILVHLDGAVDKTLKRLVEAGFFKTKAEAVRAGILELGKEYQIVKSKDEILDELAVAKMQKMEDDIEGGKRKVLTAKQALGKYARYLE